MFSFLTKRAAFAVVPLILMGLLFASCDTPTSNLVDAKEPIIDVHPIGGTWDVGTADTFSLTVIVNITDGGTPSYQWYTTDPSTGGELIQGAEAATLTLNKTDYTENGDYYFCVIVRNTNDNATGSKTAGVVSTIATVTVTGVGGVYPVDPGALIETQPEGGTWDVGTKETFELTVVTDNSGDGTLSYQWYTGRIPAGGEEIENNSATLTLNKTDYTENGTWYFYVVVKNTREKKADLETSKVATVRVNGNGGVYLVDAEMPVITTQPAEATVWNTGTTSEISLTVTAGAVTDGGTLSYQWYRSTNTTAADGEEIDKADAATLTLNRDDYTEGGDCYFYAAVTNTISNNGDGGYKTAVVNSDIATVTVTVPVIDTEVPSITTNPAATTGWNVSSTPSINLTVAATSPDGGVISYRWYSNTTDSNDGGSVMNGKTSATLTLTKNDCPVNSTYYFYAVAINTNNSVNGAKTATAVSSVATVTVTGNTGGFVIYNQTDMAKVGTGTDGWTMSATYVLADDITLANFTPIGTAATPFTGTFLGNRKTITLNSFSSAAVAGNNPIGIFGYAKGTSAGAKAVIKDLTVNSAVNISTGGAATNIGLVTGYAENVEIDNINLSGSFAYGSSPRIDLGGLAGYIKGATVIKNCSSSLIMNISPGGDGANAQYSYIGGFVGQFNTGPGIENCHNNGDVTAIGTGQIFVGGIAGGSTYAFDTSYHGYIQDSSFTGTVIGQNSGYWTFVGGIAATIVGGTANDINATTRIVRCFVTGDVSCANTSAEYPYSGGIVAYNYYGALVSQCYFTGTVQRGTTGGIVGYNSQTTAPNSSRVEDCWSGGTIVASNNTNNIVGSQPTNASHSRCYAIQVFSNGAYRGTVTNGTNCFAVNPTAKPAQSAYTAAGWNFTTVWKWGSDGYPKLRWQE